jgi:mgtE-like transporter
VKEQQKKIRSPLSVISTFPDFVEEHSSVIKESLIALLICAIGDLCAGIILGKMTFFLEAFPGLLVIIPGAIGMRGNIFGSFASRLSTNLHIGIISAKS